MNHVKNRTMKKEDTSKKGNGFVLGVAAATAAFAGYYLFGPKGKENRTKVRGWTLKAKGEVLEKLEKLEEVSEDKYNDIVESVMAKYKKLKSTTEDETDKLEQELKRRFAHVKRDVKKAEREASKKIKTTRKKVAKKVAKKIAGEK